MNKVILMGRLTRDIELKTTSLGKTVGTGSLATNKIWKDATGKKQEKAEFHNLVLWEKSAEIVAKYTAKGSQLLVEGELATRSWENKEGKKQYKTEIIVKEFEFLGSKINSNDNYTSINNKPTKSEPDQIEEINVDDIPF